MALPHIKVWNFFCHSAYIIGCGLIGECANGTCLFGHVQNYGDNSNDWNTHITCLKDPCGIFPHGYIYAFRRPTNKSS
jgi:hypothetical protein